MSIREKGVIRLAKTLHAHVYGSRRFTDPATAELYVGDARDILAAMPHLANLEERWDGEFQPLKRAGYVQLGPELAEFRVYTVDSVDYVDEYGATMLGDRWVLDGEAALQPRNHIHPTGGNWVFAQTLPAGFRDTARISFMEWEARGGFNLWALEDIPVPVEYAISRTEA